MEEEEEEVEEEVVVVKLEEEEGGRLLSNIALCQTQHVLSCPVGVQRVRACPLAVSCCPLSAALVSTVLSTVLQRS